MQRTLADASREVSAWAETLGVPVYWGSGYPIREPHVLAVAWDAWTGGRMGYTARYFPNGERRGMDDVCTWREFPVSIKEG